MTKDDKDILLKDLCARLPYGVKCKIIKRRIDGEMLFIRNGLTLTIDNVKDLVTNNLYEIKPYLFPISSMTEEQIKEFNNITQKCSTYIGKSILLTDFCNKHHIDWREFIEKELALDATGLTIY